jgi:5,6,7,8-tetrahydromethanopterin hydro-lyase
MERVYFCFDNELCSSPLRVICLLIGICSIGCTSKSPNTTLADSSGSLMVGQAIVGEGNEIADIHLLIGEKSGVVGTAFATGLTNQQPGHPATLVVLEPDTVAKPSTLLVTKVTIEGMQDAENFLGPVQAGVAKGVIDSVSEGVISRERSERLVLVISAFVHPNATDKEKLTKFNYEATKKAIRRAISSEPTIETVEQKRSNYR